MIKKYKFEEHIFFDIDRERKRIEKIFNNEKRTDGEFKRQMINILNLFEQEKWAECIIAYDDLPEDEFLECPGQELVSPTVIGICHKILYSKLFPLKEEHLRTNRKTHCCFISVENLNKIPEYPVKLSKLEAKALGIELI